MSICNFVHPFGISISFFITFRFIIKGFAALKPETWLRLRMYGFRLKITKNNNNKPGTFHRTMAHAKGLLVRVDHAGIEPTSEVPETPVLSVELMIQKQPQPVRPYLIIIGILQGTPSRAFIICKLQKILSE